ncbi:Fanconi anemia group M protein [Orussus abietinus]|uniref:Fanconi anemia group M protein n=1 Tax=Orussus abietinus TaxID=222816 RepID=UPI0006268D7A|nr:Fanconi anemia group M protein [Orussus abietinus]
MELLSQVPLFSTEPSTKGFDLSSGYKWIYPENFPLRDYQFSIVQTALYNNTLVCLPTGLGKTFIAAVVMYNFWRWYPKGKVVFMAPTKPLVAQQIYACHNIMGIPSSETIELTGTTNQKQRKISWSENRVIFATPQTFHNDLEKNIVPMELIKCVVVDEAHRALGKHSYCESIRILSSYNRYFRILALSATPGGKIDDVQEVVSNLHISKLELRDDTSPDIIPYINERKMDIILVPLGDDLSKIRDKYIAIMDRHVKYLIQNNVLRGATGNISKGKIFLLSREYQKRTNKPSNHGQIMKTLSILLTMYHAYELLTRHGLRAFLHFYKNHADKPWMSSEDQLLALLNEVELYLGPFPDIHTLNDKDALQIPSDFIFGHAKFHKLKEVLLRHFKAFEGQVESTRAIVFVEYRDIVNEVFALLLQSRPLIRPQMFVGQAGLKQKAQMQALTDFRSNRVNVLISTSVGEEGLDVGEVDLIVCFDISQRSPIRLVQRMGRTGRKRQGHIVLLVTDGKEHQTLKAALSRRDSLNNKVLESSNIVSSLYNENPRMVPPEFQPECYKMHIAAQPKTPKVSRKIKKGNAVSKAKNNSSITIKHNTKKTDNLPEIDKSAMPTFINDTISSLEATKKSDKPSVKGQSSIMRFLSNAAPSENALEVATPLQTQIADECNSYIPTNPKNVQLLMSDKAAVDFLTLCTLKMSEREASNESLRKMDMTYVPSWPTRNYEDIFNCTIPNLSILDCIAELTEETKIIMERNDIVDEPDIVCINHDISWDNNFDVCHEQINEKVDESWFEDLLLNDSTNSSESELAPKQENNANYCSLMKSSNESIFDLVDVNEETLTKGAFEGILSESSDESSAQICQEETDVLTTTKIEIDKNVTVSCTNGATKAIDNSKNSLSTRDIHPSTSSACVTDPWFDQSPKSFRNACEPLENFPESKNAEMKETVLMENDTNSVQDTADTSTYHNSEEDSDQCESYGSNNSMLTIPQMLEEVRRISVQNGYSNDLENFNLSTRSQRDKTFARKKVSASPSKLKLKPGKSQKFDFDSDDDIFFVNEYEENNADHNISNRTNHECSVPLKLLNDIKIEKPPVSVSKTIANDLDIGELDWDSDFVISSANTRKNSEKPKSCSTPINRGAVKKDSEIFKSPSSATCVINNKAMQREINLTGEFTGWISSKPRELKKSVPPEKGLLSLKRDVQKTKSLVSINKEPAIDDLPPSDTTESESKYFTKERNEGPIIRSVPSLLQTTSEPSHSSRGQILDIKSLKEKYSIQHSVPKNANELQRRPNNEALDNADITNKPLNRIRNKKEAHRRKVKDRMKNKFISNEAEVSFDVDTSEGSSGEDEDIEGFVSYTQEVKDHVDMRAHYLQTVKSPVVKPGRFIIKEKRNDHEIDVYSQPVSQEQDTYLYDSFCVNENEEHLEECESTFDELPEEDFTIRKRKRMRSTKSNNIVKRRIIAKVENDDSSDDETERLRQQILNESLQLKCTKKL